jgi:hypothetical protein
VAITAQVELRSDRVEAPGYSYLERASGQKTNFEERLMIFTKAAGLFRTILVAPKLAY